MKAGEASPRRLVAIMCAFLGLNLLGLHGLAALLPFFIDMWSLTKTEAGWLTGAPYVTYVIVIPLLAVADRIDARLILLTGAALNVAGFLGFALFADDFWTGLAFRALQGLGFAGTYMPGVKALADRIDGPARPRSTSFYVSSFAICSSTSIFVAAEIFEAFGWRAAFILPAIGSAAAFAIVLLMLPPAEPEARSAGAPPPRLFAYGPVLRNKRAVGFIFGAFAHTIELLGLRGWTVAFLVFALAGRPEASAIDIPLVATLLILIGAPMSFLGGELGHRRGFAFASSLTLIISGICASIVGFAAAWPFAVLAGLVILHNLFVLADSGCLNGGAVSAAEAGTRGALVAAYAFSNALGGLIGPVIFGMVLDLTGEGETVESWGAAFAILGFAALAGGITVALLGRNRGAEGT